MAIDEGTKIRDRARYTGPQAGDLLVIERVSNSSVSNTLTVTLSNLLGNSSANIVGGNSYWVSAYNLQVRNGNTPANSTVSGYTPKAIWADDDYLYFTTSNGAIRRVAGGTF